MKSTFCEHTAINDSFDLLHRRLCTYLLVYAYTHAIAKIHTHTQAHTYCIWTHTCV
uniref:Uncharacterized protein n=1 Tax=Anguilla anguilla TaxID=7936 RepID=A0A0E9S9A4_ANGAN